MSLVAGIRTAPEAWSLLNGLVCLYKRAPASSYKLGEIFATMLCQELNSMKTRPPRNFVELRKVHKLESSEDEYSRGVLASVAAGDHKIEIISGVNFADHPLVVGPRYIPEDFKTFVVNPIGSKISGLVLVGVNDGVGRALNIKRSRWISKYVLKGKFGVTTDNKFEDGKIIEKSTYHKITRLMLERTVSVAQSSLQQQMFSAAGVSMDSQLAYELASQGALRPVDPKVPVVYAMKLMDFRAPDFTIEIVTIGGTEDYYADLIHGIGLKLHTAATCTGIKCIKHGPFELKHALLEKHWTVEYSIRNIVDNESMLKDFNLKHRDPLVRGTGHDKIQGKLQGVMAAEN